MKSRYNLIGILAVMIFGVILVACGGQGEDRPGTVSVDPKSETVSISASGTGSGSGTGTGSASGSVSASGTGSASASGTGSASGSASGTSHGEVHYYEAMGGYAPVSDVGSHSLVVNDVKDINELLGADPKDFAGIRVIYDDGKHSVKSSGKVRTISGFAGSERSEPIWDDYVAYYGAGWLDTFVSAAIDGTGPFEGEADGVRKQGVQKGIQNQTMIAWAIHELVAALKKAEDGNFDPEKGAPHNWDEFWAFYHGVSPSSGPFGTADKRGGNFGTGTAVNDAILAQTIVGRDALVNGDVVAARAASDEIIRQIQITYIQASIRYASKMSSDLAGGDTEKARIHQAEGWAFFRVIEPMIAAVDSDVAAKISSIYDLANPPTDPGTSVLDALESVYSALGINPDEVGTLS